MVKNRVTRNIANELKKCLYVFYWHDLSAEHERQNAYPRVAR